jgi:uncharacterized membrane protein
MTTELEEVAEWLVETQRTNEEALNVIETYMAHAWNLGYASGHSNAMRRMSDEPNAPRTPNPYKKES